MKETHCLLTVTIFKIFQHILPERILGGIFIGPFVEDEILPHPIHTFSSRLDRDDIGYKSIKGEFSPLSEKEMLHTAEVRRSLRFCLWKDLRWSIIKKIELDMVGSIFPDNVS